VADVVAAGDDGETLGLAGGEGRVGQQAEGGNGGDPTHGVIPDSPGMRPLWVMRAGDSSGAPGVKILGGIGNDFMPRGPKMA
jgi:hypothetical protein